MGKPLNNFTTGIGYARWASSLFSYASISSIKAMLTGTPCFKQ
jgi:hypothetical protein